MGIRDLKVECDFKGKTKVSVWADCLTQEDVDGVIAWLELCKVMMASWGEILALAAKEDQ